MTLPTFTGPGYLGGESPDGLTTVAGVPISARVDVLWRDPADPDAQDVLVRTTQSAADGTWQITGINPELQYVVRGIKSSFDDVTVVGITPTRTDVIEYTNLLEPAEYMDGLVGHVQLDSGLPPFTPTVVTPLPFGLSPTVVGRRLMIIGSSDDFGVWESVIRVTSSNGAFVDITIQIEIQSVYANAVGGDKTVIRIGDRRYAIHTFLENGDIEFLAGGKVEVLLVGGGGSGGAHNTGGGGGAGRVVRKSLGVESGTYSVVVGIGGPAVSNSTVGNDGGPSSLFDITAPGGGGGGRGGYVTTAAASPNDKGRDGGSGGGGGGTWGGHIEPGGAALAERIELDEDLGHNGGRGMNDAITSSRAGAGGGGAGGNGEDAVNSRGGYGGDGVLSDFDGRERWLAAGGQGGTNGSGTRKRTNEIGGSGASGSVAATAGVDGTGSGGGGAREGTTALQTSGRGGNGRVVIKYEVRL